MTIEIEVLRTAPEEMPTSQEAKFTATRTEVFFRSAGKFIAGFAREALTDPPELWFYPLQSLRAADVMPLRRAVRRGLAAVDVLSARVKKGDERGLRFAKLCGFHHTRETAHFFFLEARL